MNRKERRAQASEARRTGAAYKTAERREALRRVTAIHEAGHAVGRYLTMDEMGLTPETCIHKIVLEPAGGRAVISRSGRQMIVLATTYGPLFSHELTLASRIVDPRHGIGARPDGQTVLLDKLGYIREVIEEGRKAGANIERWLNARAAFTMFGPVAEAMFTNRDVLEVVGAPECMHDAHSVMLDARATDLPEDEALPVVELGINRAMELSQQHPGTVTAIQALADALPDAGEMPGTRAVEIIREALATA